MQYFLQNAFSHIATVTHSNGTSAEKLLLLVLTFSARVSPHPLLWHSNVKAFCKGYRALTLSYGGNI